jgi:histidinol-phosphate aminotransferase
MAALPAYVPGRKVPGAALLASNESPYGLLPAVAARIGELTAGVSRYPDMSSTRLIDAIATHHAVDPARVAVGAGSVEVVGQIAAATVDADDEVVFGWRAFEAYPIITAVVGGRAVLVPLRDHIHDVDAMVAAISERTRLVLICNPNNPTGTAVGREELLRLADGVPDSVTLVVDEAYREYVDPDLVPDALELLADRSNVVVTRTFSKAYALAGLRVGYAIASAELSAAARKCQVPFSVSGLAQECAMAALSDTEEVARRAELTVADRGRVENSLRDMGFETPRSQANFVWLPLGESTARFAEHCLDHGVVVRPFAGEGVRVTIGLDTENDRFLEAARTWCTKHPGC